MKGGLKGCCSQVFLNLNNKFREDIVILIFSHYPFPMCKMCVNFSQANSQIHESFCTTSCDGDLWHCEQKDAPSMTSAKYISRAFFSSNSNPSYSGFALWRDRALRSPEIAIAHLSQGLRSSYHRQRGSFEFLSPQ